MPLDTKLSPLYHPSCSMSSVMGPQVSDPINMPETKASSAGRKPMIAERIRHSSSLDEIYIAAGLWTALLFL